MKHYSLLLALITAAFTCSSLLAQDKASLQPNASVLSILQGSAGKSVELHLRSGEKMGGKVAHVTDSVVHLSNLTGAEYFDAFIDLKDVSAVIAPRRRQIDSNSRWQPGSSRFKTSPLKNRLTESIQDCQSEGQLPILIT